MNTYKICNTLQIVKYIFKAHDYEMFLPATFQGIFIFCFFNSFI